ncbi:hypothetical protein F0562_022672 [Nyssa sinensis]|uniref:F-box domain-containing protein n=1 Tax=Nyssa sinensis TaxID=561372 RepID=A0A5J5BGY3_9ASTE|nr:hypothetical protein F0562_022672 [Nyssa sinensis]
MKKVDQMIPWLNHCRKRAVVIFEGNDDVFIEILIRLPIKSLLKCKCVCKWWRHLISDPFFIRKYSLRNPHHRVSGFYLQKFLLLQLYSELKFIAFDGQNEAAPQPSLSFIEDERGVCIQHSCNGLLICSSFRCHEEDRIYYICKPTTKQYFPLPRVECKTVICINIAFDPNKSPNYSMICICDSKVSAYHRQIKIYNSDTGSWRVSGNPFFASDDMLFNRGVFWNGALHWVGRGDLSLRFDVEREVLVRMPMPPIHEGWVERRLGYFGESGGHLYLIEIYGPNTAAFDVMEMNRDYSGWFVKYHVNLNEVAGEYPAMLRENVQEIHRFVFSIMHMIHRGVGKKEETLMVLHIPGKFISYNLMDQTFKDLRDISDDLLSLGLEYSWEGVHPYTNTLSYI